MPTGIFALVESYEILPKFYRPKFLLTIELPFYCEILNTCYQAEGLSKCVMVINFFLRVESFVLWEF